jgi:hypothetical protein
MSLDTGGKDAHKDALVPRWEHGSGPLPTI